MKTKFLHLFLFLFISNWGFSQDFKEKKEKIRGLKIAFISQKLSLTPEEAEKFWPVYNKYDTKIMDLKEGQMKLRLKKKMRTELIPIIGADKVVILERSEQEFHRKLLNKLKDRKGPPPPRD